MDKLVHVYVIHSVDPRAFENLNPLDEANDFPVPNDGVVLEEIVDDVENGGGEVLGGVLMIEYPIVVEENEGNVVDEGNDVDLVENEGNDENMHENEGNAENMHGESGGTNKYAHGRVTDGGPTGVNETNQNRSTEFGEGLNNDINVADPSVVDKTGEEGTTTGLDEELRDGLDINLEDDEKEDSALEVSFGDSEEELGDEDNFGDVLVEEADKAGEVLAEKEGEVLAGPSTVNVCESTQGEAGPSTATATVGESSQGTQTVGEASGGSKPKKKRGRPKKQKQKNNEPVFEDEVLAHQVNRNENGEEVPGQSSIVRERGLSDNEEYNSDELDSGAGTEDEEENIGSKHKFPTFKQPENMRDYEWEAVTYFVSKKQFQVK